MKTSFLVGLSGVCGLAGCQQTELLELVRQQQAQNSQLETEIRSALLLHGVLGGVLLLTTAALALLIYLHVRKGGNSD